jgi:uncharacterized protein YkwD
MQQHDHLALLQGLVHLPAAAHRSGSKLGAVLTAVRLARWAALAALLVCTGASVAAARALAHLNAHAKAASARCSGEHLRPRQVAPARVERATLCVVDRVRAVDGLSPLAPNRELRTAASSQVRSMIHDDYFSDVRPAGQTPMSIVAVTHYPAHTAQVEVGQNIAWGTGPDAAPVQVVAGWLASPAHREVMLSDVYREAGVAVAASVPALLSAHERGATYAMELGAR